MEHQATRAPVVLIVEPDRERARRIYRSLRRVRVPRPYHVRSDELGREWLQECWPDLCIFADGELAARMQDDLWNVPIVVLSSSDDDLESPSDHPAGIDLIPTGHGSVEALAVRVRQMLVWIEAQQASDGLTFQMSRTTSQLKLPYAQRLRAIGRQLDREDAGSADLLEVPGGFIARIRTEDGEVQIRDYREGDIPWLLEQAESTHDEPAWRHSVGTLRPEGHEALLRAIGQYLDRQETGAVTINDLGDQLVVSSVSAEQGPLRLSLGANDVLSLMHDAAEHLTN